MDEMCDDISLGAFQNVEQNEVSNFKKMSKKWKVKNFTLSKENYEKKLDRSSTLRVSRAEIWLTVYRSIYIRMQEDINCY